MLKPSQLGAGWGEDADPAGTLDDREWMIAKLEKIGMAREAMEGAPEVALAEIIRWLDSSRDVDEDDGQLPEAADEEERKTFAEAARGHLARAVRAVGKYAAKESDGLARLRRYAQGEERQRFIKGPREEGRLHGTEEEREAAKVAAHFDKFAEYFPRGATKESLVAGFKCARKSDGSLTAAKFLGT